MREYRSTLTAPSIESVNLEVQDNFAKLDGWDKKEMDFDLIKNAIKAQQEILEAYKAKYNFIFDKCKGMFCGILGYKKEL